MFKGFSPQAWSFFRELKRNNRREWFLKNRHRYDRFVLETGAELAATLSESTAFRKMGLSANRPEKALFRLNRDLRFSADKSPYKTHNGLLLSRSGERKDTGVFYLHLEPGTFFAAFGFWYPDAKLLRRLRLWAAENPGEAKAFLSRLKKNRLELSEEGTLSRLPKGFESFREEPLSTLLKFKSWVVSEDIAPKEMASRALVTKLCRFVTKVEPLATVGWKILDRWRSEGGDAEYQERKHKKTSKRFSLAEIRH